MFPALFEPKRSAHALLYPHGKTLNRKDSFTCFPVRRVFRVLSISMKILNPELVEVFQKVFSENDKGRVRDPGVI